MIISCFIMDMILVLDSLRKSIFSHLID